MTTSPDIALAIVGLGKIARDQHLPAIASVDGVALAAVASRNAGLMVHLPFMISSNCWRRMSCSMPCLYAHRRRAGSIRLMPR